MNVCKRGHTIEEGGVYEHVKNGKLQRQCRLCALNAVKRRAADPAVIARRRQLNAANRAHINSMWRERRYGVSVDAYQRRLEAQDGLCAICRRPEKDNGPTGQLRPLGVDHDHELGVVRGLLCNSCNRALGLLRDDPETVEAAARYLRKWWPVEAFKDAA